MEPTQIKETCLYINDLALARAFYAETLGLLIIDYHEGKHLFLRAGSSVLLCFQPDDSRLKVSPPPHYAHGKQHFAFEVPQHKYEQTKGEIVSKGIEIVEEVIWKSGVRSFYFNDPEGNVLEVVPDTGLWD
jgi:catechol 2,3-dioxygenase-like lactoylglutathione lyase family enzyme